MVLSIRREPGCQGGNQLRGFSLAQRGVRQRLQDAPVGGDLLGLLQEKAGRLAVQVGHRLEFGELHQLELSRDSGVSPECGRHHPQSQVGAPRHPQQVVQLLDHHGGPADRQPQRELVQVEGEPRRAVPAEQTLPSQPGGHPILDLARWNDPRLPDQRASILAGLQQAGHHHRLEVAS